MMCGGGVVGPGCGVGVFVVRIESLSRGKRAWPCIRGWTYGMNERIKEERSSKERKERTRASSCVLESSRLSLSALVALHVANEGSLAAARGTIRGQACRHATKLDNRTDTTTTCMNINNTVTDTTAQRPHGGGNGPPSPEAACQDEPKRNGAMGQGTGWLGLAQQHPAHAPTPLRSPAPRRRRAYRRGALTSCWTPPV